MREMLLKHPRWEDVRSGLFNEAYDSFSTAASNSTGTNQREARFGQAVALLNVQPRTQANINRAYDLFEQVRASASSDDLGLEARYLQGRIEQVQRATPDLAKAEAIFSEIAAAHPRHPIGQRARVKLALLRLFTKIDAVERRRRFDDFTSAASELTDAGAKVQMHLLLAETARRFTYGDEQELAHLLAADEIGVTKRTLQIQALVRVGDLARLTGKNELARAYYTRFLEQFPRTDRRSTIEGYLAALNPSS
jgi:hypothetical protein